jgi:hypothetical protein
VEGNPATVEVDFPGSSASAAPAQSRAEPRIVQLPRRHGLNVAILRETYLLGLPNNFETYSRYMDYYYHALLIVEPQSGVFIDDGVTADDLFQAVVKSTGITPFYVSIPPGGRNGGQGNFPSYINFLTMEQTGRAARTLGALDIGGRVYDTHSPRPDTIPT